MANDGRFPDVLLRRAAGARLLSLLVDRRRVLAKLLVDRARLLSNLPVDRPPLFGH
jgi:hypothetical protein